MSKQELPKWFKGKCYEEGGTVKNPLSGEECELNNFELSMYDFIIGSQLVFEMARTPGFHPGNREIYDQQVKDFQKALNWFRKNNAQAYTILLD